MPDFPSPGIPPLFITATGMFGSADVFRQAGTGTPSASLAWSAANQALFMPVWLPWPYTVRRVFWGNGSVTASSHTDFGIYSNDGARIYSTGSTVVSGASTLQYVTPTAFLLSPGRYFFAFTNDGTTNRVWGVASVVNNMRLGGMLEQATALPLPDPATFVAVTHTAVPLCGITKTASGF